MINSIYSSVVGGFKYAKSGFLWAYSEPRAAVCLAYYGFWSLFYKGLFERDVCVAVENYNQKLVGRLLKTLSAEEKGPGKLSRLRSKVLKMVLDTRDWKGEQGGKTDRVFRVCLEEGILNNKQLCDALLKKDLPERLSWYEGFKTQSDSIFSVLYEQDYKKSAQSGDFLKTKAVEGSDLYVDYMLRCLVWKIKLDKPDTVGLDKVLGLEVGTSKDEDREKILQFIVRGVFSGAISANVLCKGCQGMAHVDKERLMQVLFVSIGKIEDLRAAEKLLLKMVECAFLAEESFMRSMHYVYYLSMHILIGEEAEAFVAGIKKAYGRKLVELLSIVRTYMLGLESIRVYCSLSPSVSGNGIKRAQLSLRAKSSLSEVSKVYANPKFKDDLALICRSLLSLQATDKVFRQVSFEEAESDTDFLEKIKDLLKTIKDSEKNEFLGHAVSADEKAFLEALLRDES